MVEKPRKRSAWTRRARAILEHPSLYPTTLALFAAFHLLLLGLRTHELVLSSEFIVFAAACRTFPLIPISRQIRFLRFLVSAGLSILSAISALAGSHVHTWRDILAGLQQHRLPVILLALLTLAAEKVAEARNSNRLRTTVPVGYNVLHNEQEALFELPLKEPSRCVINLRVSSHLSTPLYTAEVRDTNNRFTIYRLNCSADLATCDLPLEKGRYLVWVKKLNGLEPSIRVTVHALVLPLSPHDPRPQTITVFPDPTSKQLMCGDTKNRLYAVPTVVRSSKEERSANLRDPLDPAESEAPITTRVNIFHDGDEDARRRAEEDGAHS
jgi:hypothetical protein